MPYNPAPFAHPCAHCGHKAFGSEEALCLLCRYTSAPRFSANGTLVRMPLPEPEPAPTPSRELLAQIRAEILRGTQEISSIEHTQRHVTARLRKLQREMQWLVSYYASVVKGREHELP